MAFLLDTARSPAAREVSPLGASRFERPLLHDDLEKPASSEPNSPSSPLSDRERLGIRFSRPSRASTNVTATTAPTSVSTPDAELFSRLPSSNTRSAPNSKEDIDAWFARFQSDDELSLCTMTEYPDRATLAAVHDIPLYDAEGTTRTFGSLYDPATSTHQRQLFVFVRHFYCGACQAYLQALTEGISQEDYFGISIPTAIIVIGCGQPDLIRQYKKFTSCPWTIYADPTRQLFKKLGMSVSFKLGKERPEYMKDTSAMAWLAGQATTIRKSLKDADGIRKRDIFRGGNPMQIGGEFLFDQGEVVWCHRMQHYRNHAEVSVVRKVLDIDPTDDGDGMMW